MIRHASDRCRIETTTELDNNWRFRLQTHGYRLSKQSAKLLFVLMFVLVANYVANRQFPESTNTCFICRHADRVTGRNGVDTFVRRVVRISAEAQEPGNVLLVEIGNLRRFYH